VPGGARVSVPIRQPTPAVTLADVDRIALRDYPAEQVDEVLALLRSYGVESWEVEVPRVRLALLRLGDGDMAKLRLHLDYAKRDYRDVLLGAEYLLYAALTLRNPTPGAGDAQAAINADWASYTEWLRR
jgi:hypothetical protein